MADLITPDQESLGRQRFPDNKAFRQNLYSRVNIIMNALYGLLPSNYPKVKDTNLAGLLNVLSREFGRQWYGSDAIMADKQYTQTRPEFLQQILGERLFLGNRIAPASYNDESFRKYLIALKDAYLKGGTIANIMNTLTSLLGSPVTGLPNVRIKELYKEARKPNSSYDVSDSNMMAIELTVEDAYFLGGDPAALIDQLKFLIGLIKPAHVLYDTKIIWADTIDVNKTHDILYGDTGGGCVPVYDVIPFYEKVVLALQISLSSPTTGANGRIGTIHFDEKILYLDDNTLVITDPDPLSGTMFFDAEGRRISFADLRIGNYIKMNALPITGDFQFWYLSPLIGTGYDRFYPSTFRRPVFQENVKKVMDAQGRFPLQTRSTPTTVCDRWVQDYLQPYYEDLRRTCREFPIVTKTYSTTLAERMKYPRLSWPSGTTSSWLLGSPFTFMLGDTPVTDSSGNPAAPSDISVSFDGTTLSGSVSSIDASTGTLNVISDKGYWDASSHYPVPGDVFRFGYDYLSDGTVYGSSTARVFGVAAWQMPSIPMTDGCGSLADSSSLFLSVDGTAIQGAVATMQPLLGHIWLNDTTSFWMDSPLGRLPAVGDEFRFTYKYGGYSRYGMLFDDFERVFDTVSPLSMVFDGGVDTTSGMAYGDPMEIGYRYRAEFLQHSSVLNSPDTLTLNDYQKPAFRASLANRQNSLNHMNLFFSPEFLYDKSSYELNDRYLDNGLDPVLKLREGTPTFQQTFGYQPGLVHERKLHDIRKHRNPLLYTSLLLKEFPDDGESVPLSSLCDNSPLGFKMRFRETLPPISECDPWMFFDYSDTTSAMVTIPGLVTGEPNLRVRDMLLRYNFMLRDRSDLGIGEMSYSTVTLCMNPYRVQLPYYPITDGSHNLAVVSDVSVLFDGTALSGSLSSIDSSAGVLYINDYYPYWDASSHRPATGDVFQFGYKFLLDGSDMTSSYMYLPSQGFSFPATVKVDTDQYGTVDFPTLPIMKDATTLADVSDVKAFVDATFVSIQSLNPITGSVILGVLVPPDSTVSFSYIVEDRHMIRVFDPVKARVLDDDYDFGGICPDPVKMDMTTAAIEYINFLDDYSSGIRKRYFNKTTWEVEDRVFSGPVFELCDIRDDEFSPPESFPNALVSIPDGAMPHDAMGRPEGFDFTADELVRFRRKTFKELLPDRSFRTTELVEMMPI